MKKVFLVTATVFFVSLLLSCQNFLSGQNTKQELIDAINYNNAPSCPLLFKADDGTGTFLTGTEKICKAGYSIDVQFSVNSQAYLYTGMQAVSRANPTVSRKDFIEFTELSTPEEIKDGTIKTKIRLLKKSDDIMICPVCLMRPSITHCTEFTKDGYNANTPIEITFNMPMESEQEK